MKHMTFVLLLVLTLTSCKHNSETRQDTNQGKQCKDCVATDFPGADSFGQQTCTAPSTCTNNNPTLIDLIANLQCSQSNTDKCTGDCGKGNRCDGIYERARSKGLTVNAAVKPGGNCPGTQVLCDVTLTVPAGGLLACKCSCNPAK